MQRKIAIVILLILLLTCISAVQQSSARDLHETYTLDADFNKGVLVGVEHDTVHDQLQLPKNVTTFPLMWIANAGEDTVSKWDTNTNKELARYRTWFGPAGQPGYYNHLGNAYAGAAPSRTAVDLEGNAYVANRHFDGRPADVIKIFADDWIDRNHNGVMDTSTDTSNNGVIDPSDPSEILPMADTNGNSMIDPAEIQDERIAWAVSVGPNSGVGRSLAIAPNGHIWLGLWGSKAYFELSSVDGSSLGGPSDVSPNQPYGALVDGNGILWGASGSSYDRTLLRLNTNDPGDFSVYDHSAYGRDYSIALGTDSSGNTIVYQAEWSLGRTYIQYDSSSGTFSNPAELQFPAYGIATDSQGNILASNMDTGAVAKFRPDGSLIWSAAAQVSAEARGTIVDSNDDVWVIHLTSDEMSKFSGSDGAHLGVFNTGNCPYTYSDATGLGLRSVILGIGYWTVTFDSGGAGTLWYGGQISWTSYTPTGTSVEVKVRSSNGCTWSPWETATSGLPLSETPSGRYLQIRTTLQIITGDVSPILYDLTVDALDYDYPPDINIWEVIISKWLVCRNFSAYVYATIGNQGDFTETFNVTAYANATVIGLENVTLPAGNSTTITFTWNTAGFAFGNYSISAFASPVEGETNTEDNTFIGDTVLVTIPGDISGDQYVNAKDAVILGGAFGAYSPNADINSDGWCNAKDAVILGTYFGQHWP